MNKDAVYYACRICYSAGSDKIPWHILLHALRQGLGLPGTHFLTPEELRQYPDLLDLLEQLKRVD